MKSGLLGIVIWLPVLVGLWVGVVGLGKAGRGVAWWMMLGGMSSVSLGLIVTVIGSFLLFQNVSARMAGPGGGSSPGVDSTTYIMMGGVGALGIGVLLFAIGFALHGFQARRSRERISDLEMLIEAQNEQLARAEGGPAT